MIDIPGGLPHGAYPAGAYPEHFWPIGAFTSLFDLTVALRTDDLTILTRPPFTATVATRIQSVTLHGRSKDLTLEDRL